MLTIPEGSPPPAPATFVPQEEGSLVKTEIEVLPIVRHKRRHGVTLGQVVLPSNDVVWVVTSFSEKGSLVYKLIDWNNGVANPAEFEPIPNEE
jgi:hypothetical protein